jgi:hypothetical protein
MHSPDIYPFFLGILGFWVANYHGQTVWENPIENPIWDFGIIPSHGFGIFDGIFPTLLQTMT